jgi:hypothetical protein
VSTVRITNLRYLVAGTARFKLVGETELANKSTIALGESWDNTPACRLNYWSEESDKSIVSI